MNFCSHCGHSPVSHRIPQGDHRPRFWCESCGHIFYENPRMIVGCVPTWKDKLMLCRRGIEPRKGYWNAPGGFMENGESVEEGALREVFEETGANVHNLKLLSMFSVRNIHQVHVFFTAELESENYVLNEESTEIRFFAPEEIPWDELAFPSNHFCLRAFCENLRTGKHDVHVGGYDGPDFENSGKG